MKLVPENGLRSHFRVNFIRTRSTTATTEKKQICNFGAPSPLDSFEFSQVDSCLFSPGFMCNLVRKSPQNVEKMVRFPGGERCVKSCHVSGCHGSFFFSGPNKYMSNGIFMQTRDKNRSTPLCLMHACKTRFHKFDFLKTLQKRNARLKSGIGMCIQFPLPLIFLFAERYLSVYLSIYLYIHIYTYIHRPARVQPSTFLNHRQKQEDTDPPTSAERNCKTPPHITSPPHKHLSSSSLISDVRIWGAHQGKNTTHSKVF